MLVCHRPGPRYGTSAAGYPGPTPPRHFIRIETTTHNNHATGPKTAPHATIVANGPGWAGPGQSAAPRSSAGPESYWGCWFIVYHSKIQIFCGHAWRTKIFGLSQTSGLVLAICVFSSKPIIVALRRQDILPFPKRQQNWAWRVSIRGRWLDRPRNHRPAFQCQRYRTQANQPFRPRATAISMAGRCP